MSEISPMAFIGDGVTVGERVKIGPGVVILGPCTIEDDVWIGPGAQIGAPPEMAGQEQNTAWTGDLQHFGVRICAGAVIREGVVVHQGTHRVTTVGARSWLMNRSYLAHDVQLGADATISAGVSVGGHCTIGDRANLGMNAVVHQRRIIAPGAMVGMGTPVTRDVPPFAKVYGTPPRLTGVNSVGIERAGFPAEVSEALLELYAAGDLLVGGGWLPDALEPITDVVAWWRAQPELSPVSVSL